MPTAWITTSSTRIESVVNPLIAACDEGYVPDRLYYLTTPQVDEQMKKVQELAKDVVDTYDGDELEIKSTKLDSEVDFESIHSHVATAIETIRAEDGEVAVDITPGRKFMTAIAFATGMRYDADHVYYLYLDLRRYGQTVHELPRTAVELYDFTQVME
jgi:hypothetical protein